MALTEHADLAPLRPQRGNFWQWVKSAFSWLEFEATHIKGLTLFGIVSTLVVAYFQNLSAYEAKVASQAKDDMTAAAQIFAEASGNLSGAIALQRHLISDFYAAVPNDVYKDDTAFLTKDARAIYTSYSEAYSNLHQNYNLLARKAEIYLDWPSDLSRDPVNDTSPAIDPINMSLLGAADFDCESSMPNFAPDKITVPIRDPSNGRTYQIDWRSALHHVLTIQYCFDVTHSGIAGILQWASHSNIDPKNWSYLNIPAHAKLFNQTRATNQVLRLNAFMSVAMHEIDAIRVKYRPNGFICSLPGLSGIISAIGQAQNKVGPNWCTPIRTS